jgi:hypothetical protein
MLGFRPFVGPICRLAREVLPPARPLVEATDAMTRATEALRDGELRSGEMPVRRQAFEAARDTLAATLAEVDDSGLFSDLVVADLIGIEAGQSTGLNMAVESPPPRNLPFLLYVTTVRRNHVALWTAAE